MATDEKTTFSIAQMIDELKSDDNKKRYILVSYNIIV